MIKSNSNFQYQGSSKFSYESLLHKKNVVGDICSKYTEEIFEFPNAGANKETITVKVNRTVFNPSIDYQYMDKLDNLLGFSGTKNMVVGFLEDAYDPNNYAEYFNMLGVSTEDHPVNAEAEEYLSKQTASRAPRYDHIYEDTTASVGYLIKFKDKQTRDTAIDAFKWEGLYEELNVYPYEELNEDVSDSASREFKKYLEFSVKKTKGETLSECNDRVSKLVDNVLDGVGYLSIRNY